MAKTTDYSIRQLLERMPDGRSRLAHQMQIDPLPGDSPFWALIVPIDQSNSQNGEFFKSDYPASPTGIIEEGGGHYWRTLAHEAARQGVLPGDFRRWTLTDRTGRTVAHDYLRYQYREGPLPDGFPPLYWMSGESRRACLGLQRLIEGQFCADDPLMRCVENDDCALLDLARDWSELPRNILRIMKTRPMVEDRIELCRMIHGDGPLMPSIHLVKNTPYLLPDEKKIDEAWLTRPWNDLTASWAAVRLAFGASEATMDREFPGWRDDRTLEWASALYGGCPPGLDMDRLDPSQRSKVLRGWITFTNTLKRRHTGGEAFAERLFSRLPVDKETWLCPLDEKMKGIEKDDPMLARRWQETQGTLLDWCLQRHKLPIHDEATMSFLRRQVDTLQFETVAARCGRFSPSFFHTLRFPEHRLNYIADLGFFPKDVDLSDDVRRVIYQSENRIFVPEIEQWIDRLPKTALENLPEPILNILPEHIISNLFEKGIDHPLFFRPDFYLKDMDRLSYRGVGRRLAKVIPPKKDVEDFFFPNAKKASLEEKEKYEKISYYLTTEKLVSNGWVPPLKKLLRLGPKNIDSLISQINLLDFFQPDEILDLQRRKGKGPFPIMASLARYANLPLKSFDFFEQNSDPKNNPIFMLYPLSDPRRWKAIAQCPIDLMNPVGEWKAKDGIENMDWKAFFAYFGNDVRKILDSNVHLDMVTDEDFWRSVNDDVVERFIMNIALDRSVIHPQFVLDHLKHIMSIRPGFMKIIESKSTYPSVQKIINEILQEDDRRHIALAEKARQAIMDSF